MAATGLPELDVARIRRWCEQRVPERVRNQVRIECEEAARHVTVVEYRAPWSADIGPEWTRLPVARLRYTKSNGTWALYYRDRNLRFHRYDLVPPTSNINDLLNELDQDATGIFWG